MEDIIISDEKGLNEKIREISEQGIKKLHVLTDFDRTLTSAFVEGKKVLSLISVLREEEYLSEDYSRKAKALFKKYHAIELGPEIPMEKKKKEMMAWWTKHFKLIIKSGLNRKDIEKVVDSGKVKLRPGVGKLLDFLFHEKIPLIIISSGGLGKESISLYLQKEKKLYDNIHIISNSYEWDKDGYAKKIITPIIHVMNKDETIVKNFPFFRDIKNRKNVLLLGDSLGDIEMTAGFEYDNLIKIGFLNYEIEKNLKSYKNNYDVVILNDGKMDYVNRLLEKIVNKESIKN